MNKLQEWAALLVIKKADRGTGDGLTAGRP